MVSLVSYAVERYDRKDRWVGPNWRRGSAILVAAGLLVGSCGDDDSALEPDQATTTTSAAPTTAQAAPASQSGGDRVVVEVPPVPPIVLPDLSELDQTGQELEASLGALVDDSNGLSVLSVTCDEGDLVYQGSTGADDIFDIETDGSGQYRQESPDGLVTLEVDSDGVGSYYDKTGGDLLTISAQADGAGTYYKSLEGSLVTVETAADGSGAYFRQTDDSLTTIEIFPAGNGEYYQSVGENLTTVKAAVDGSGAYYSKKGDELVTLTRGSDGSWQLSTTTAEGTVDVGVRADGSGVYDDRERGIKWDFDAEGRTDGGPTIVVSNRQPEFTVASRFPPVGKLRSLNPPCATVIRLDSQFLFDFNSAVVRDDIKATLAEVVSALEAAGRPVEINGHTDSIGREPYNLDLSLRRAEAVRDALVESGLTVPVTVNGLGAAEPVAPNTTDDGDDDPAGRQQNRRVEIVIRNDYSPSDSAGTTP